MARWPKFGLGRWNSAHAQRAVAKPPLVRDMNARQKAAHEKRKARANRNNRLVANGGFERKP
jgi:hypothetical protein